MDIVVEFNFMDGSKLTQTVKGGDELKIMKELNLKDKSFHLFEDNGGLYEVNLSLVKFVRYYKPADLVSNISF